MDGRASQTMLESMMYKMCYYRFGEVTVDHRQPPGFDRARESVIGNRDVKLEYIEEAFTTTCVEHPYDTVFILEPWEAIFTKDNERYESFEEALQIDNALKHTYKSLGYQPVVIPKCSVAERVTFIEQYLKL